MILKDNRVSALGNPPFPSIEASNFFVKRRKTILEKSDCTGRAFSAVIVACIACEFSSQQRVERKNLHLDSIHALHLHQEKSQWVVVVQVVRFHIRNAMPVAMILIKHNIGCLFPDAYLLERDEPVLGEIQCIPGFAVFNGKRSINPHPWLGGIPEVEMEGDSLSPLSICRR